jgi:hypothetical protein
MRKKDDILLEQAYNLVINPIQESHDDDNDGNIFHIDDTVMFDDPTGLPYSYEVSYEKKMESGFYDDSVVGVEINSAKAYKKDSDEVEFLFDITNETKPNFSDIQDWVYNWAIGDLKLDIL